MQNLVSPVNCCGSLDPFFPELVHETNSRIKYVVYVKVICHNSCQSRFTALEMRVPLYTLP